MLRVLRNYWPFLLGLALGLTFVTFQVLKFDLSIMPGDLGDTRFNNYVLEHGHKFITGQIDTYWNAPFMHPEESVISYSDNLLGTLPLYSIWRALGIDRESSFQLWYILITIFNFSFSYLLFKRMFKDPYSAVVGAFVFTFSLGLISQLPHAQTFPRFFIPLMIWALIRFRENLATKYFFLALLFLVWQFYAGIYLGFMSTVLFGTILIYIVISEKKRIALRLREKFWLFRIFMGSVFNSVVLGFLMYPYWLRSKTTPTSAFSEILPTIPTIRSYFTSPHDSFIWDFTSNYSSDYPAYWDHQIFPGAIAMIGFVSLLLILVLRKKLGDYNLRHIGLIGSAGIVTGILFFRYNAYSPYFFLHWLPGFGSMRSMARIINVELIFFAAGCALGTYYLVKRFSNKALIIFVSLLFLLCIDNLMSTNAKLGTPKAEFQRRRIALTEQMKNIPEGSIISYEPNDESVAGYIHQLDAMTASQEANLICLNGYTATSPGEYTPYWWNPNEENRIYWLNYKNYSPKELYVISPDTGIKVVHAK